MLYHHLLIIIALVNAQTILALFKRDIDLVAVIDDFGELIYREIDYRLNMMLNTFLFCFYAQLIGHLVIAVSNNGNILCCSM